MKKSIRSKEKVVLVLFFSLFLVLSGCGQNKKAEKQTEKFSTESVLQLKKKAKKYTEEELQTGGVPLHDFIQISGVITKTDSKTTEIKKGDRFVLKSGQSNYQILNQQTETLKLNQKVTVYGEYYGFITASYIEILEK